MIKRCLHFFVGFCLFISHLATATLGERVDSIERDRQEILAARPSVIRHENFTVQELKTDGGVVREYVNLDHRVFGVAWSGPTQPVLSQLLGKYYEPYQQARQTEARFYGQRMRSLTAKHLVVELWGPMRMEQGRAYDPNLLPPQFDPKGIE